MWSRYPNTVSVEQTSQGSAAGIAGIPTVGTATSINVDFQLMTPGRAFEVYGVQLNNPARIYAPASYASSFPQGARVTFGGVEYAVVNSMVRNDGTGTTMSYTLAILERIS